ncbi:MAG: Prephenate dehydratase [Dehalococcoidia bacterium]|nr:Prephenate dehydratase [Dehalococcoidia bacterium]
MGNEKRVAYFGPAGTFTEEAALSYDPQAQLIPFPTIPAVAAAVSTGMADEGVVPIENSIEGSVNDTLDLLIHESQTLIRQEIILPIEQCLLVKPGTPTTAVEVIYSHPQALAQCRRFLERCFPKAQLVAALSTAAAVEEMMKSSIPSAAVGPQRAALLWGAQVLARGIQDHKSNLTRFVVLAATDNTPTGADKTSFCFSFAEDKPGLLLSVLQEFANRKINLAKVESRPSKDSLGKYIFLIDLEGHRLDPIIAEALARVHAKCDLFKMFGSYPRFKANN